jgi:ADP-ribose pyrophosphatase
MWKKIASKYLFQSPWLSVRQDKIELPNGEIVADYILTERKSVALVVVLNKANQILLKREYRYPINAYLWELPGGTFNLGEDPLACAKRELLEETGYASDDWSLLGTFYEYPTKDAYQVFLYLAKAAVPTKTPEDNPMEVIDFQLIDLEKAKQMVRNNEIKVAGSALGILLLLDQGK